MNFTSLVQVNSSCEIHFANRNRLWRNSTSWPEGCKRPAAHERATAHFRLLRFICLLRSSLMLAKDLLAAFPASEVNFIMLYRHYQDLIEHIFGDVRSRGAWCLNPSAL
jgi:hypothetical protein